MRPEARTHLAAYGRRGLLLRAFLTGAAIMGGLGALVVTTTPKIVAAPTSAALAPVRDSPAIAERPDGSYERLMLQADPHVAAQRTLEGAGAARALRLAVALVNFEDAAADPFSVDSVATTMFAPTESLASLYAEQSFGLTQISGDVFGWLTVEKGTSSCDFSGWADSAAAAIGVEELSAYTNLLIVFPETPACEWSGLAYVGGTTAWINGEPSVRATAHELGHNLGLGHASSLACGSASGTVALGADCRKADEYGDPFTVMGSGGTLHMNGIHKLQLGWLAPENVVDVERSGTFTLAPLGGRSAEAQVLRVRRGDSTIVVEYRQPVAAFERFGGPFEPAGGVTARLAQGPDSGPRSLLVDATPATDTHADARIAVGHELLDELTGIRIATRSTSRERAEIEVALPGANPAGTETSLSGPSTLVAVTSSGLRRTRVDLSWLPSRAQRGARAHHFLVLHNGRVIARPRKARLTRFEPRGKHVYRIVAVASDGTRSAPSPRLLVVAEPPRPAVRDGSPLRGIAARPTADGRLALSRGRANAAVRVGSAATPVEIPGRGALALQLSTARTRLIVRSTRRTDVRPVRVLAVRNQPLAG